MGVGPNRNQRDPTADSTTDEHSEPIVVLRAREVVLSNSAVGQIGQRGLHTTTPFLALWTPLTSNGTSSGVIFYLSPSSSGPEACLLGIPPLMMLRPGTPLIPILPTVWAFKGGG